MQVICKNCQGVLQVDSKSRGKKTRCGHCNHVFEIVDPKQVAADKKAKRAADAKAKKAKRAAEAKRTAEAKAWEESIKPMPALPKREFKKKVKGSRLNRPFSIENWLLDTARQWIIVVYFLVTAMFMLTIGAGLASIFFVPNNFKIALYGAIATFLIWMMFTVGYALFAAPVIALIRIEKNTRPEG
jgi:predicted Zn finger-like uncharacterized protein